jgi:hypothetical protein
MGTEPSSTRDTSHYTGVVLIHGIGDEKRNDTLEEAVNALTHWLNQVAGLEIRPSGSGRVWVTTDLTIDDNPSARASRASIEIEAPATSAAASPPLHLEVREVWWAQAFGAPAIGQVLKWARVQAREEAARVLLPLHAGGVTYLSEVSQDRGDPTGTARRIASGARRGLLRAALVLYMALQYVWKLLQWIILTPVIYAMLLLASVLRLLALLPFLTSGIIGALSRALGYISLHWIGPLQVYVSDYTRSTGIRHLFDREVESFLRDEQCDRIVVVAHSLGTAIAYDGLTTLLAQTSDMDAEKPITFICLAQALRRLWLVSGREASRFRAVLPAHVRWLHFWARYDPVAAGPVTARSVPRNLNWSSQSAKQDALALSDSLNRCVNFTVVNTDSLYTDHTSYWENLEQVVGPIAHELASGNNAVQQLLRAHLANDDAVLTRRWRVAWRSTVALFSGFAAGVALLALDFIYRLGVGRAIRQFLESEAFRQALIALLTGSPPHFGCKPGEVCPAAATRVNPAGAMIDALKGLALYLQNHADALVTIVSALVLMGVTTLVVGQLIRLGSPATVRLAAGHAGLRRVVLVLALVATGWYVLEYILYWHYGDYLVDNVVPSHLDAAAIVLGAAFAILAWLLSIADTLRSRRWGWLAVLAGAPVVVSGLFILLSPISAPIAVGVYSEYVAALIYGLFSLAG